MLDVLFQQRLLSCAGLLDRAGGAAIDGHWGPKTQAAQDRFDVFFAQTAKDLGAFDPRTEGNIHTLLPVAQVAARHLLLTARDKFNSAGMTVKILSGTRTYAEQDALFSQSPKVTNARGGQSNHNFGIAFDVGVFAGGEYYDGSDKSPARARMEEQAYIDLRAATKASVPEIEWGGDWSSIIDRPHYQLHTGKTVTAIRQLFEAGIAFV